MACLRTCCSARALLALALLCLALPRADGQTLLHRLDGLAAGDRAGAAVGGGWDVDGDGTPDVIVGMPDSNVGLLAAGAAQVCSGATGLPIHFLAGTQVASRLGSAVALIGDLNGDGRSEWLVGAPLFDTASTDCGRAYVRDGNSGTLIKALTGS